VSGELLPNFLVHSHSWKVDTYLAGQVPVFMEPHILYCVQRSLSMDPALSHLNLVHTLTPCFCWLHFNIISYVHLSLLTGHIHWSRSFNWSHSLKLFSYNSVGSYLPHACYMLNLSHPDLITWMKLNKWVQSMELLIQQFPPSSCYFLFLRSIYFPHPFVLKHCHVIWHLKF
jgi:hypothetical protein